jgi:hypothetical protein
MESGGGSSDGGGGVRQSVEQTMTVDDWTMTFDGRGGDVATVDVLLM